MRRDEVVTAGELHGNAMADRVLPGMSDDQLRSDDHVNQVKADARVAIGGSAEADIDVTVEGHRDAFVDAAMGAFSRRLKQARRLVAG